MCKYCDSTSYELEELYEQTSIGIDGTIGI